MLKRKSLSVAVHRVLCGAAIAGAAGAPGLSHAQNAPAGPVEEVVVTGSRIATDANVASVSPITTIRSDEITARGITRVEDLMNSMPQLTPEFDSTESNGASGTATLDLRGLTSGRTLVLTNGHRMGFGDPFQLAPDVNQVPTALIQRVEVLTGGASATYGSDAVAGVVNFIMKNDFQGFQFNYQYAGYRHSQGDSAVQQSIAAAGFEQAPSTVTDGDTTDMNITLGVDLPDGKGNVEGYIGYRSIAAILESTRDFSACTLSNDDGTSCGGSATLPTGFFAPFDGTNYYTVQGNNFVPWDGTYYNYGALNYFQRPDKRYTGGLFGHYKVSPAFEGYTEFQFMDDHSLAQIAPSGDFFVTGSISCDNPLLSAQEKQTITNAGYPCGAGDTVPWYIGRRNVEGGPRYDDLRHTSYRILGGVRGDIGDHWHYDVSANLNNLRYSETYHNDLSTTRIVRALDVITDPMTGQPACRSAVPDANGVVVDASCVPWNIFQTGGVTQAAINYLRLPLFSNANMTQDQYVAYATGDLGTIPSANEPIGVAFGAERIDNAMDYNPDLGFQSGDGAGQGGPIPPVVGTLDVDDYFGELKLPLLADKPGANLLDVNLRYHHSSYTTGVRANTSSFGVEYAPVSGIMLRGSVAHSIRAANILELFQPQAMSLWGGTDPCGTDGKHPTPELTMAQCANTGVTAAQYGTVPLNPAGQYNELGGGSLDLAPEKSDSTTFGVVLSNLAKGLTLSVDYWRIKINDAISTRDPEFVVRQCGLTDNPTLCSLIHRGPNGNLWVPSSGYVTALNVNIGYFDTDGIDLVGNYTVDVGKGSLNFNLRATHLGKFDKQPEPGAAIDHCAGVWGGSCNRPRPTWRHTLTTTWTTPWRLGVSLGWRRISSIDEYQQDRYTAPTKNFFDLSGTYSPTWLGGQVDLSVGINNLTDEDPPVSGYFNNVDTYVNGNTFPGVWDALGRYYFVSFNYHL